MTQCCLLYASAEQWLKQAEVYEPGSNGIRCAKVVLMHTVRYMCTYIAEPFQLDSWTLFAKPGGPAIVLKGGQTIA